MEQAPCLAAARNLLSACRRHAAGYQSVTASQQRDIACRLAHALVQQLLGSASRQCAVCSVRQTGGRPVGRQRVAVQIQPCCVCCRVQDWWPELPSTEGAMSASATTMNFVRFHRTLGCISCWVRVGRALYTGAFLHSYVQCPVCRHRWHTTPALPPPRLGACS